MRIGELLVGQGVLTEEQVERVLEEQAKRTEPFGSICERLFDVAPDVVEDAWVQQYAGITEELDVDGVTCDPTVVEVLSTRQAWQFRLVPVRWDAGTLVMATTREHLLRALRFATNAVPFPVFLVLTDAEGLGTLLERHFPMGGLGSDVVDGAIEQLSSNLVARAGRSEG